MTVRRQRPFGLSVSPRLVARAVTLGLVAAGCSADEIVVYRLANENGGTALGGAPSSGGTSFGDGGSSLGAGGRIGAGGARTVLGAGGRRTSGGAGGVDVAETGGTAQS